MQTKAINFFKWMACVAIILTMFSFSSCSKDEEEDLIGTWIPIYEVYWKKEDGKIVDEWEGEWENPKGNQFLVFNSNHNCKGSRGIFYDPDGSTTWTYKDGVISFVFSGSGEGNFSMNVVKLTSSELILENYKKYADNSERYSKVTLKKSK